MVARRTVLTVLAMLVCAGSASAASPRWVKLTPDTSPTSGIAGSIAYDAATKQLVLYGTSDGLTWTWDGTTWTPQPTLTHPNARTGVTLAYDAATKQLIAFGGQANDPGSPEVNETWSWDGSKWTQLAPASSPPADSFVAMADDPASSQIVLFNLAGQTWTWDGSTWTQQSPATSPPGLIAPAMGYDPVGKGALLFGGVTPGPTGVLVNDTWRWNGTTWTHLAPAKSPAARNFPSMALDGATNQLLLVGGSAGGQSATPEFDDEWAWSGSTWKQITPATIYTPARFDAALAYDPDTKELVLFGGGAGISTFFNDTWVYTTPQVQTPSLTRGAVGVPYSQTLQAIGGKTPYTWSVSSGTLPAGLTLSAAGKLSGTPTTAGASTFTIKAVDASGTPQSATRTYTLTVNPAPQPGFYAAGGSIISAFPLSATSSTAPRARITGALTGLAAVGGLAFDGVGELYVTNTENSSVEEFSAGSNGNVAPVRTITGPATGLAVPYGVTLDGAGRIYVADEAANAIRIYPARASGSTPPAQVITGPDTGLSGPWGLTIVGNDLWVANYGTYSLTEYATTATGDARPINTIAGPTTGLSAPQGLGQDGSGNLLVANFFGRSVTSYSPSGPFGDVPPKATFTTAAPGMGSLPQGVDVDTAGRLFVADENLGVFVFPSGATSPSTTINGGASGLVGADAVAVAPPLAITTARLPEAAVGRRYSARLEAVLGQAPLRWRLVRGTLPRGLHLARSGRITGTPKRTGRFRITVGVRDAGRPAQTATHRVTLVVGRAPVVRRIHAPRGSARGGRRVTIRGSGFSTRRGATTFEFGRLRALGVRCSSHTRCTMRTPPHSRGTVGVTASVNGLTSARSRAARYRFTR